MSWRQEARDLGSVSSSGAQGLVGVCARGENEDLSPFPASANWGQEDYAPEAEGVGTLCLSITFRDAVVQLFQEFTALKGRRPAQLPTVGNGKQRQKGAQEEACHGGSDI